MDLRGAAVAVTGATGFLGRYITDVLLARGAHVIGVVRNPGRVPELAARGVELRQADLAERDRLAQGFAGAQAVVSNAALFSLRNRSWEDHHRANIQGTENVFGALADAGVKRVVHVSSVAVYRAHGPPVAGAAQQLLQRDRRRSDDVGVRARVAGGRRPRRARPAAAPGSVAACIRHHAGARGPRLAEPAPRRGAARDVRARAAGRVSVSRARRPAERDGTRSTPRRTGQRPGRRG